MATTGHTASELPSLPLCGRTWRLSQEAHIGSLMVESLFLGERASEVWSEARSHSGVGTALANLSLGFS